MNEDQERNDAQLAAFMARATAKGPSNRVPVDREQTRRDARSIEDDVVTVRGFLDYPTASGRRVYLLAVEALDRLAFDAHKLEQAQRENALDAARWGKANTDLLERAEQAERKAAEWEFIAAERGTRMDEIQTRAEQAERKLTRIKEGPLNRADGRDEIEKLEEVEEIVWSD